LDRLYKKKERDCKRTKYNPVLHKIQECSRNRLQHTNRMSVNGIPRVLKKPRNGRQKEPGETVKDTSGYVRTERVNF